MLNHLVQQAFLDPARLCAKRTLSSDLTSNLGVGSIDGTQTMQQFNTRTWIPEIEPTRHFIVESLDSLLVHRLAREEDGQFGVRPWQALVVLPTFLAGNLKYR